MQSGPSDAERRVLADQLLERGDPRGELIHLDLRALHATGEEARDLRRRADALRARHREHLLGVLSPLVGDAEWDRGFLTGFTLASSATADDLHRSVDASAWRDIRTLHVPRMDRRRNQALAELLSGTALGMLEHLTGPVGAPVVQALVDGPPLALHTLTLGRGSIGSLEEPDPLFRSTRLPALRHLTLDDTQPGGVDLHGLASTPVGRCLQTLRLRGPFEDLPHHFRHFTGPFAHLQRLQLDILLGMTGWTMTRDGDRVALGVRSRLALLTVWRRSVKADIAIAEILDLLPPASVSTVDVEIGGAHRPTAGSRRQLQEAVRRVTRG